MPIYEFHCKPCEAKFEVMMSASRLDEAACPTCGSTKIRRIYSPFFAHTGGGSSSQGSGCSGCASGNCGSCSCSHHH